MLSLEIMGCHEEGKVGIYVRDYACQGENPDYSLIAKIPYGVGQYLVEKKLINDLYGMFDEKRKAPVMSSTPEAKYKILELPNRIKGWMGTSRSLYQVLNPIGACVIQTTEKGDADQYLSLLNEAYDYGKKKAIPKSSDLIRDLIREPSALSKTGNGRH